MKFPPHKSESDGSDTARSVPPSGDLSDEELMLEVQQGNGLAFTALFDRYNRLVLTVALRIVHDVAEAQEVTQDVFFEFYRTARRFDPARGTLKVWLLQFAYCRAINRRNYLALRQFYNRPDLDEAMTISASPGTVPQMQAEELKLLVSEALVALPPSQRVVIEKVMLEGLTLREVAESTRTTYPSVRNRYYRGIDRLRDCLEGRGATTEAAPVRLKEIPNGEA